jgi:hypothetical protein
MQRFIKKQSTTSELAVKANIKKEVNELRTEINEKFDELK